MRMKASVSVIIVNYHTPQLTQEAAESALADPLVGEVIIVDNSVRSQTEDDSKLQSWAEAESNVLWDKQVENLGFGSANNVGAKKAHLPYLFLLNSDATLQPGALARTLPLLDDIHIGLAAPPVYLSNGTLQPDVCGSFPTPWGLVTRATARECTSENPDWLSGVALLVRRTEFLEVGGFAPALFMYYEDVELCWRYWRRLGRRTCRLTHGPGVVHLGGASRVSTIAQKKAYFQSQDYYLAHAGFSWATRVVVQIVRWPYLIFGKWFLWKK